MGVQWDSVRATHSVSADAYAWKTTLGQGRTLVVPPGMDVSCFQIYTLARLSIDSNLCDTLEHG
jgi:hypothetical protein